MRVLITGATGFVGRHLVKSFLTRYEVVCLVREQSPSPPELQGAQLVYADLARPLEGQDIRLPNRVDAVVHLAQARVAFPERAKEFFAASTGSTLELLEYGRRVGIQTFVYASSGSVYGFSSTVVHEQSPLQLKSFYSINKRCSELLVESYGEFFSTHVLRLFFPYGPGQRDRRIPMIAERVLRGQPVDVVNGGQPRINPIYVDDLVVIIDRALSTPGNYVVNVAGDEIVTMVELAQLIGEIVGCEPVLRHGEDPTVSDLVGDNTLMHRLYRVVRGELTPLREGLRSLIDDLREASGLIATD